MTLPTFPVVQHGSLAGLYADSPGKVVDECAKAATMGIPYSTVGILDDGGAPIDIARVSPTTHVFLRYYNPQDDSLQNLFFWSPQQEDDWVTRSMNMIENRTSDATARATYRFIIENEPDPPQTGSYFKLGKILIKLIDECERCNTIRVAAGRPVIRLAIGCFPQGVPEWSEMLELDDSGLFSRMQQVDAVFVMHEGVFREQNIRDGYGSSIPGAPIVKGAGSACFRFVYLFEGILRPRGHLVKLWIGEWYPGGLVTDTPEMRVPDYEWYDNLLRLYEYAEGFVGFTSWPHDDWKSSDLTPTTVSDAFYQSRLKVRERVNGGLMPTELADADLNALHDHHDAEGIILAKYPRVPVPHVWKVGDVALANTNPLNLYGAPNGTVVAQRPPTPPGGPMITYDLNVIAVTADQLWLEVATNLWVKTADVKLKAAA